MRRWELPEFAFSASSGTGLVPVPATSSRPLSRNNSAASQIASEGIPDRAVKHVAVFRAQDSRDPFFEGRRLRPQIEHHVVDCSLRAADDLRLRVGGCLIMHSAQRSLSCVERNIALRKPGIQPVLFEFSLAPGPCKEAAVIGPRFKVDLEDTWQLHLVKGHCDRRQKTKACSGGSKATLIRPLPSASLEKLRELTVEGSP